MIDPLAMIWPEFLKFRFSLHIVKDDWPPGQDFTRIFKV